jgi:hypothetical protein
MQLVIEYRKYLTQSHRSKTPDQEYYKIAKQVLSSYDYNINATVTRDFLYMHRDDVRFQGVDDCKGINISASAAITYGLRVTSGFSKCKMADGRVYITNLLSARISEGLGVFATINKEVSYGLRTEEEVYELGLIAAVQIDDALIYADEITGVGVGFELMSSWMYTLKLRVIPLGNNFKDIIRRLL